jgi:hypothetical protein
MVPTYHAGDVGKRVFVGDSSKTRSDGGTKKRAADNRRSEQFGSIQTPPQSPIGLSCREIRSLFWELGLAVRGSISDVLGWSSWRRWHQAWARYYHYRRRDGSKEEEQKDVQTTSDQRGDTEVVWSRLEPLLAAAEGKGRPCRYSRRAVLEAIVYVMKTNCGWRGLSKAYPPWQTVYAQLRRWQETGIWDTIWAGFTQPFPTPQLQL